MIINFKIFESKFNKGDYVYPKQEHCSSRFMELKPKRYTIYNIRERDNVVYCEIELSYNHYEEFPLDWFLTELEYNANKYNI